MALFIIFTEEERGVAKKVTKINEEMALLKLIAFSNKVTEQKFLVSLHLR
jgi:hypothetical protein